MQKTFLFLQEIWCKCILAVSAFMSEFFVCILTCSHLRQKIKLIFGNISDSWWVGKFFFSLFLLFFNFLTSWSVAHTCRAIYLMDWEKTGGCHVFFHWVYLIHTNMYSKKQKIVSGLFLALILPITTSR